MLEEEAQMMGWDTHGACPGYIEAEDRKIGNKNHEGFDDVLDRTDSGLVAWKCCSTLSAMLPSTCPLERP